ncbi:inosine 5'-monophosphate dehydrogenase [bacterium BMS3Abin04]|nr:inosine 5'-monophosphate dehydrogenase [bacterium BMS3Abin04]
MIVSKWMSKRVVTVDESDTLSEAVNTLKRNHVRRLPVLRDNKLIGIVSDRDLKEAAPSRVTSLDMWELHYLLSKIKVKDLMKRRIITISPDSTIEKAAILMFDNKIGGLPVVENEELVGIITEHDVFNAFINITGARIPSYRITVKISDEPGSIKELCDKMRIFAFKCVSILTTHVGVEEGYREVIIRFRAEDEEHYKIIEHLEKDYPSLILSKE